MAGYTGVRPSTKTRSFINARFVVAFCFLMTMALAFLVTPCIALAQDPASDSSVASSSQASNGAKEPGAKSSSKKSDPQNAAAQLNSTQSSQSAQSNNPSNQVPSGSDTSASSAPKDSGLSSEKAGQEGVTAGQLKGTDTTDTVDKAFDDQTQEGSSDEEDGSDEQTSTPDKSNVDDKPTEDQPECEEPPATDNDSSAKENQHLVDSQAQAQKGSDNATSGTEVTGTFENQSVSWTFKDSTLTIAVDEEATNTKVSESGESLPWKTTVNKDLIRHVVLDSRVQVQTFESWFDGYQNLATFEVKERDSKAFDVSGVSSFANMFRACSSLTNLIGMGSWQTSPRADYTNIYSGCSSLASLDLSSWSLDTMTKRSGMFAGMDKLSSLNLSNNMVLTETGLDSIENLSSTSGAWMANNCNTAIATSDLVAKYNGKGYNNSIVTYNFLTSVKSANNTKSASRPMNIKKNLPRRAPSATNGFFTGSASNVYWNLDGSTLTITTTGNSNITIKKSGSELPWKQVSTPGDISTVKIDSNIKILNFSNWFAGYNQLKKFEIVAKDNVSFDASIITSFNSMFMNCTNLESVIGLNGWSTSINADYTNMFSGCNKLASLDLSGWNVATSSARAGMFQGLTSIVSLNLPGTVVLAGTGLDAIASRGATAGTWQGDGFEGSTKDLVNLYTTDSSDASTKAYTFAYTAGFASDDTGNVRWSYDTTSGALLIYVVDASGSKAISASADQLPWLASVDKSAITSVTVRTTDDKGVAASITPASLKAWLKDYTGLLSFDGRGFDVSATNSFASLFQGDVNLATVNLSGWVMPAVARDSFFGNCVALSKLILTKGNILAGTGLSNDLGKLNPSTGSWDASVGDWFGTTDNLVNRYPEGSAFDDLLGDDPITYDWHPSQIAGRFANDNAWWKFENKTLTLGVSDASDGKDLTITEAAADQPWLGVTVNGKAIKQVITTVVATGGIKPLTLASWFLGYSNLDTFDGSGMDVSQSSSFASLFQDLKKLKVVNLSDWVMQEGSPRDGMFEGCSSLTTLTLGRGVILDGAAGFDTSLDSHGTTDGSWLTEGETWFGSTEDLARRYPSTDASLDKVAYTWSSGMKSGRFISNDNAWWKFDEVKGILTVGVTVDANSANQSRVVTELASVDDGDYSKLLPWANVIPGYKTKVLRVIFEGDAGNRLQPTNPEGWFEGFSMLSAFDGSGLDFSHVTDQGGKPSLARFFKDCPQLGHADGLDQWDVSQITDLSHLFEDDRLLIAEPAIDGWNTGKVTDFSYLFHNAVDLTEINKVAKWNVSSAKTFEGMFEGAENVVKLDLSGWSMPRVADLTGMLKGAGHIVTLVLGPGVVLEGAGFEGNDERGDTKGSWDRTDDPAGEGRMWFGTTGNLVSRYPKAAALITDAGTHTYVWADGSLRGRFASNDNAWWTYDGKLKQLVIGTTFQDADHNLTVTETAGTRWLAEGERPAGTSQQPWVDIIEEKNCYNTVRSIVVKPGASLCVTNIYKWFTHYEALNSIDLSGLVLPTDSAYCNLVSLFDACLNLHSIDGLDKLDVSAATSFDRMFAECRALTEVTGVSAWNTSKVTSMANLFYNDGAMLSLVDLGSWDTSQVTNFQNAFWGNAKLRTLNLHAWDMLGSVSPEAAQEGVTYSRANMLQGCLSLNSITLGPKAILTGTGFDDTLSTRTPVQGSWDASDKVWFGSTSNVNVRYPESKEATVNGVEGANLPADQLTYTWADGSLRGRFQNDNAWWKFIWDGSGKTAGTLWIGADTGSNKVITERQDDAGGMPWVSVIGQAAGVSDGTTLVTKVVTDAAHTFQIANPASDKWVDWFCGYQNLTSFDGSGLDTSNLTTLANFFKGCTKLATVTGLDNWDVTKVTSLESLFDSCPALKTVSGTQKWVTTALTSLKRAFAGDSSLQTLTTVSTWDTSKVVDFTQAFAGDYSLATLYLDNWNMTATSALYLALFEGCKSLSKLRLGKDAVLEGTGFGNALVYGSDYTREAQDGSWNADDANSWFGSSSNLTARYPVSKTGTVNGVEGADLPAGLITYTWAGGQLAGRFQNDHAWWKYDTASGALTIGADEAAQNKVVTETAAQLPWSSSITDVHFAIPQIYGTVRDYNIAGAWHNYRYGRIRSIVALNKVAPQNLEGWFAGYDLLGYKFLNSSSYGSFDGRGMDVSSTSSFANLFQGDAYLAKVDLSTWLMREDANAARAGMFSGCTRLGDTSMGGGLTVGAGTILVFPASPPARRRRAAGS